MDRSIPHDGLDGPQRYLAVLAVSLGTVLTALTTAIVNIALPTMMNEFHVSVASSILIVNAYQIAMAISLLPFGALGTIIGYRPIFLGGLAVFTLASLACALSHSFIEIVIARAMQGFGAAGIVGVLQAVVRSIYPMRILGRGIGINSMFVASSAAFGPSIAAAILSVAPWPYLFYFNLPFAIAAMIIGYYVIPLNETTKERFNLKSAGMIAATFGLFILSIDSASHGGKPIYSVIELAAVAVILPILVRAELERPSLLPLDLFKNRIIALSMGAGQCCFIAQLLAFVTMPFFLHDIGFSQVQIGLVMTPWPLTIVLITPGVGLLCDRYPPGLIGAVGLVLATAGLLLLAFAPRDAGEFAYMWRMALSGLGVGLFSPPNMRQIMMAAPKQRAGLASGMIGTNRLTGQSIGAALAALVFSTTSTVHAHTVAFGVAAGMTALAAWLSLARAPAQRK